MTKDQAEREVLHRWHSRPSGERQNFDQAIEFAAVIEPEFDFRTMGHPRRVIAAWLIRDIVKFTETAER